MEEITHCHNQRPIYETEHGEIVEWDSPSAVAGDTYDQNYNTYHPFVIDIETSAELNQSPILLVGYNSLSKHLVVLYEYGFQDYFLKENDVSELAGSLDYETLTVHTLTQANVEKYILKPIAKWNKKARKRHDNNRISLVAHNASFDIPMLGSPDDGLLQLDKIGDQYEMAVQYADFKMVGHRAGQFGHIYQFLDSGNEYDSVHIPVGDTMVAAKAMWIQPASLKSCCESLNIGVEVSEAEEHGILNDEYVEYCINDVEATYELHTALQDRISRMFEYLPLERIYSTASIGKHVLRTMNYKRVGYEQEAIDRIAPAYFGGRTDANVTGEIVDGLRYTDFLSQYPTASKLTGVWEYMTYESVTIEQIEISELPDVGDLRKPENWSSISDYYVKIKPQGCTLPVRTPHLGDTTKVVTSKVHSETEMQYHYMDIIAAELIDDERKFEIVAAWEVHGHGEQDLEATEVGGVTINPHDNVMAKCIEARKNIKHNDGRSPKTVSLKITGNSLYGISAERVVKETPELGGSVRQDYATETGFYNPHVATTITASGRLMIALGQHLTEEYGGELIYCDTDSLLIPDTVSDRVIQDFQQLNPYNGIAGKQDFLEDEKGVSGNLYAVGTKKYVFFADDGEILEYKEHGLGNYENLRDSETIKRLWATIMYYDLDSNPLDVDILYDRKLNERVIWSFTATTVSMRTLIDQFTEDYLRYGDWIQSTLSYDDYVRYIAVNLTEKEPGDTVCEVKTEDSELISASMEDYEKMRNDSELKTVRDVVFKFAQEAKIEDEIPHVEVTELRTVTKESTSRQDIFLTSLEKSFKENMKVAVEWVFD